MPQFDPPKSDEDIVRDNDTPELKAFRIQEMLNGGLTREQAERIDLSVRQSAEAIMRLLCKEVNDYSRHLGLGPNVKRTPETEVKASEATWFHLNLLEMVLGSCHASREQAIRLMMAAYGMHVISLDGAEALEFFKSIFNGGKDHGQS